MKIKLSNISVYLLPFACFFAAINALLPSFINALIYEKFTHAALRGFGHSYVIWMCIGLALTLAWQQREHFKELNQTQLLLLLALCLLLIMPSSILCWFVCAAMSLLWLQLNKQDKALKVVCSMLVVISLREPLCQALLHLFAEQILTIDAWLSGALLKFTDQTITVSGNTISQVDGHTLLILTGCSAFNNLSLAMLLWFCLSMYLHTSIQRPDYQRLVILLTTILSINTGRLALMAINEDWYHYLHDGRSQELIDFLTISIALLCIRRSKQDEHNTSSQTEHRDASDHRNWIKNQ